ncbi:hypothetical protein ACFL2A_00910 [Thermodesulfobacteriota bacterium]
MVKDEEVVEALLSDNVEFRKFMELHSEYEVRLENLNKKHYLTDSEKLDKQNLKKKKLATKDKMTLIIKEYKAEH